MSQNKKKLVADEEGNEAKGRTDFIRALVESDVQSGRFDGRVQTRFPPEPNGYLHIGHAKAICLNFALAEESNGICKLRFDDTNPETEDERYVEAILEDLRWLGFSPDGIHHSSAYFPSFMNGRNT